MTNVKPEGSHNDRVKQELEAVGMTKYGFIKAESRHLPGVIQDDEHIGGVIYGRDEHTSAMLVATNKRLLFLDHKLFFKKTEEISYDAVSGISYNKQGEYAAVTVHSKFGDFTLRFVNTRLANHFVHFVENIRVTKDKNAKPEASPIKQEDFTTPVTTFSQEVRIFLNSHEIGVLSTIDQRGNMHGATIYYTLGADDTIFFVTKNQTEKAKDILVYGQVALTIYDNNTMQTAQISGHAEIEQDKKLAEEVSKRILRPRLAGDHATVPPILHISAGEFIVVAIKPTSIKYHDYKSW